ncbi:MAG: lysozyme inhibitor LprI family protein [Alteraurantiacibacter sp.]
MSLAYPLLLLLSSQGVDCAEPMTQRAMNYCAGVEFEEADEALNIQWNDTAARMRRLDAAITVDDDRPGYFDQLLTAQRAWLSFRDNHCASVGYYARGGSLEPLLIATCKTELTLTRTDQLRALVENPD